LVINVQLYLIGLYALGANILATNCVFANCGQYALGLIYGGFYEMYHCTVGNYWKYSSRTTPSVLLNNYYKDVNGVYQVRALEKAIFGNCIIDGNQENEVELDEFPGHPEYFIYNFDHCLLKANSDFNISDGSHFSSVIIGSADFIDVLENDYQLEDTSPAKDYGDINIVNQYFIELNEDINGISRTTAPDLGAYEIE